MTLSAVIVGSNQAEMVRACLERLGFVDEIVFVVDARSGDETEQIAREFTDKVFVREFDTFAGQRNFAIGKAEGEWILVVDVDERVTPQLAEQVQHAVANPGAFVAFTIPMAHFGFGKQLRGGGWRNAPPRLMRRENARYRGEIEEVPEPDGPIGILASELWHFSHTDMDTMLKKIKLDAPVFAQQWFDRGDPPVTVTRLLTVPARAFFARMIRDRGYQDGVEGVIEATLVGFGTFCILVMLWERQRSQPLAETYATLEARATEERPERVRGRFVA